MTALVQVHRGHVSESGKLTLDDREGFLRAMHGYAGRDVEVVVRIADPDQRSLASNKFYFGVVVRMIADEAGMPVDDMHEEIAAKFLTVWSDIPGEPPTRISTASLGTKGFSRYVESVMAWASEFYGIRFPEPGEVEAA